MTPPRRRAVAPAGPAMPLTGLAPGIAYHYAGCCRPVPGDPVVGLIRTGRPVSVHRAECRVLTRTRARAPSLEPDWNSLGGLPKVSARLSVTTMNRPGLLGSISTVVGKQGANIVDLKIGRRTPDIYELLLDVEVGSVEQLQRVQAALRATAA